MSVISCHFIKNCPQRKGGPLHHGNHWDPYMGDLDHPPMAPPGAHSAWSCSLPSARWIRWADLEAEDIAARNLGWGGPFSGFLWVLLSVCFLDVYATNACRIKCVVVILEIGKYAYTAYTMHRQKYQFHHKFGLHIESTNVTVYNLQSKILKYNAAIK